MKSGNWGGPMTKKVLTCLENPGILKRVPAIVSQNWQPPTLQHSPGNWNLCHFEQNCLYSVCFCRSLSNPEGWRRHEIGCSIRKHGIHSVPFISTGYMLVRFLNTLYIATICTLQLSSNKMVWVEAVGQNKCTKATNTTSCDTPDDTCAPKCHIVKQPCRIFRWQQMVTTMYPSELQHWAHYPRGTAHSIIAVGISSRRARVVGKTFGNAWIAGIAKQLGLYPANSGLVHPWKCWFMWMMATPQL